MDHDFSPYPIVIAQNSGPHVELLECWIIRNSNESVRQWFKGQVRNTEEDNCKWLCKGREGWSLHCHIKEHLPIIMRLGVSTHAPHPHPHPRPHPHHCTQTRPRTNPSPSRHSHAHNNNHPALTHTITNICCSKRIVPLAYHVLCGALWRANTKQDKVCTSRLAGRPQDRE